MFDFFMRFFSLSRFFRWICFCFIFVLFGCKSLHSEKQSDNDKKAEKRKRRSLKSKRHLDVIRALYSKRWINRIIYVCDFFHSLFLFVFLSCFLSVEYKFSILLWICQDCYFVGSQSQSQQTQLHLDNSMNDENSSYLTQMQALLLSIQSWNRKHNKRKSCGEAKSSEDFALIHLVFSCVFVCVREFLFVR